MNGYKADFMISFGGCAECDSWFLALQKAGNRNKGATSGFAKQAYADCRQNLRL